MVSRKKNPGVLSDKVVYLFFIYLFILFWIGIFLHEFGVSNNLIGYK